MWKFSLCYYTVNVVYNDSSEEPASQYVISNYDCDWCINSEKIALPYQTLDMLKTVDKNCIINSINEVVDNASKNQSEVGTLIYALHPDITTYSTLAAKDWYFGKLIKSDVDEVFILNNDRQDDIDYPDGVTLSGKLPYNDEVGYMLSQDIPALKKAFCKVTKKWQAVGNVILTAFSNPYVLLLMATSVYNAIIDPTTTGITDSKMALTYNTPNSDK